MSKALLKDLLKDLLIFAIIIATVAAVVACTAKVNPDKPNVIHHKVSEC